MLVGGEVLKLPSNANFYAELIASIVLWYFNSEIGLKSVLGCF